MIKNLKNLGKTLTKGQQKEVKGGNIGGSPCNNNADCWAMSPFFGPGDVSCRSSFFSPHKVCVFN